MYCGYCGEQMDDDLKFCPHCGKPAKASKKQSPKKKKPAKEDDSSVAKTILLVLGGIVVFLTLVFFLVLFFTRDDSSGGQRAENPKTQTESKPKKDSEQEEYLDEEHKIKRVKGSDYLVEIKTDNGTKVVGLKSNVLIGVTDVVEKRKIGNDEYGKRAQGRFVIVRTRVFNGQNDAISFTSASSRLVDSNNREYSTSTPGETAWMMFYHDSSSENSLLSSINPGTEAYYTLIFDVPPSVPLSDLKLKVSAGFTGGYMILPFNFVTQEPVDVSEYLELKEKYNQEIGDIVNEINANLGTSTNNYKLGTTKIKAVGLRGQISMTKTKLKSEYEDEYDHSKSNLGTLIEVFDALEERVSGLIEGMDAATNGRDYNPGFQRGAAAYEKYEQANSRL